jgi:hypothetical protein
MLRIMSSCHQVGCILVMYDGEHFFYLYENNMQWLPVLSISQKNIVELYCLIAYVQSIPLLDWYH